MGMAHPAAYQAAAGIAAAVHLLCHRAWARAGDGTPRRALFDGLSHGSAALAVIVPAAPRVPEPGWFLATGLAGGLLLDLDHILAAQSIRLDRCMTMPARPPTHSFPTALLASVGLARLRPWRGLGLGLFLGLMSHLLRDLGTGGAPVFHPRRVIECAYPTSLLLTAALAVFGCSLAARSPLTRSQAVSGLGSYSPPGPILVTAPSHVALPSGTSSSDQRIER